MIKISYSFLFFLPSKIRKARKKKHTQIGYNQKSKWRQRSVNYHDSGTDPFSKTGHVSLPGHSIDLSLPFLPSFLRSFLFVDHGRDQRKSPLKGEPSVVAKPLERNHRWRSARICETSLAIFLDLFCPRSKINKPLSILLFPIVSLLDQIVSFLSIDRTDSFVPIKVRLLEDRLKRDERGS